MGETIVTTIKIMLHTVLVDLVVTSIALGVPMEKKVLL
jgi:hypothetical protein